MEEGSFLLDNIHDRRVEILLVEDNPGDAELTAIALRAGKVSNRLSVVVDGMEAMAFLRKETPYEQAPRPDLILMDLNMPRKDGRETLADIRKDPLLHNIPVVILTTSESKRDVIESYHLNANCYITKPVEFEAFMSIIRSIEDFWFSIVKLPPS